MRLSLTERLGRLPYLVHYADIVLIQHSGHPTFTLPPLRHTAKVGEKSIFNPPKSMSVKPWSSVYGLFFTLPQHVDDQRIMEAIS